MSFLSQLAQETLAVAQEAEQRALDQLQSEEGTAKAKAEEEALDAALDTQSKQEEDLAEDYNELDEVVATVGELEKVEGFIEARVTEGGMSPNEARAIEIATESIYRRLGVDVRPMKEAALEAFGHPATRLQVSVEMLDAVKETGRKVIEAIKKFFATIWEKIKLFVASFQLVQKQLVARAKKLKDAADGYFKVSGDDVPAKPVKAFLEIKKGTGDYLRDKQVQAASNAKLAQSVSNNVAHFTDGSEKGGIQAFYQFFKSKGYMTFQLKVSGVYPGAGGKYYFGEPEGSSLNQIYLSPISAGFMVDTSAENVQEYEINALAPSEVSKAADQTAKNLQNLIDAVDTQLSYIKKAPKTLREFGFTDAEGKIYIQAAVAANKLALGLLQATIKVIGNQERRTLQTLTASVASWPALKDVKYSDSKELAVA